MQTSTASHPEYELRVANPEGIVSVIRGTIFECQDRQDNLRDLGCTRDSYIVGPGYFPEDLPVGRIVQFYGAW